MPGGRLSCVSTGRMRARTTSRPCWRGGAPTGASASPLGITKYHGASTGRWSSQGVQLHKDLGAAIEAVATGTGDPKDEPYHITGAAAGLDRDRGKTCTLALGYMGGVGPRGLAAKKNSCGLSRMFRIEPKGCQ
jgi:hypothetical protein